MKFSYNEFITRNIGFITEKEQEILKGSKIFIAGTGGMGGAAIACLARCGVGEFIFADIDFFEVSNLNRQIFANLETIEVDKAQATADALKKINPEIKITVLGEEWVDKLDKILPSVDLAINGCDDIKATITLMRKGQEHNKVIIDAFASTLPSVYVVSPKDPRPEVTFNYPSVGKNVSDLSDEDLALIPEKETEYVLTHSSTANHVEIDIAAEMVSGKRSRISFAPMVWMTGCLMSYEAIKVILGKKTKATHKGVFINPWTYKIERPLNPVFAMIKGFFVRQFLKRLL